jgi:hypothetical protein
MLASPEDGKNVAAIERLIGRAIPPFAIDGIAAAALDAEASDGRRSRRGEHRGAERRPERSPRNTEQRDRRPRRDNRPPRQEARHEPSQQPHNETHDAEVLTFPGPAGAPVAEPRRRRPREPAPDHRSEPRVVGFGDDLPAFLRRAPRVAAEA